MVALAPSPALPSVDRPPSSAAGLASLAATARDFDDDDPSQGAPLLEALLAQTARPSRLGLPGGAGAVFRAAGLVALAAIALAVAGARLGLAPGWVRLFDNLHWTAADIGAAWLAWIGVRDAREKGQRAEHLARRWFAVGFTSYAIGQLLWDLQILLAWQPFPAPSDPFYMLMAPCCALGMLGYLRGRVSESQRLAAVLDTLSLAIAVVALALEVYLPRRGDMSTLALGVMIAYPTLLLAGACVGLMLVALLRVGRNWPVWALAGVLAAHGALWMEWNALTLAHALSDGGVVNALFSVCTLLGGLAVTRWRVATAVDARLDRFYEGALRVLPLVVVVGVTFAVTLQDSIEHLTPSARTSSFCAMASCCSAVDSSALRCSASRVRSDTRRSRCWFSSLSWASRSRSRPCASISWSRSRSCSVWRIAASAMTTRAAASQAKRADGVRCSIESCSVTAKVTPTTTTSGSTRSAPS